MRASFPIRLDAYQSRHSYHGVTHWRLIRSTMFFREEEAYDDDLMAVIERAEKDVAYRIGAIV